jgi:TPR repeat protein
MRLERRMALMGIVLAMMAIAIWVLRPKHRDEPLGSVKSAVEVQNGVDSTVQSRGAAAQPVISGGADLWARPSAKVAARNARRVRFSSLKRFGASNEIISRLTDGDIGSVIRELKERASTGETAAANILERLVWIDCASAAVNGKGSSSYTSELLDAQALAAKDADWVRTAIDDRNDAKQAMVAACQGIDKDAVLGWVRHSAEQGDGASLLFLSFVDNHLSYALAQSKLQEAADAHYPEAESYLAQGVINGTSQMPAGVSSANAGTLLRDAARNLPYAESELAVCEFNGCPGIDVDIASAVAHAREAAQHGNFDAIVELGPKFQASQMDPDEVQAWGMVAALLAQQGCSGNGLSVHNMTSWMSALSSKALSPDVKSLAEQYWRDYGAQMMSDIGCSP